MLGTLWLHRRTSRRAPMARAMCAPLSGRWVQQAMVESPGCDGGCCLHAGMLARASTVHVPPAGRISTCKL